MNWIIIASGKPFYFDHPEASLVTIEDIAHALSNICRFCGHTKRFYSVAQHAVLVSYLVPPEHALSGLGHDNGEAVLGDVTSPLKRMLPDYKRIEAAVEQGLLPQFGVQLPLPACVKYADLSLLMAEQRDLMRGGFISDIPGVHPYPKRIWPWPRWYAKYRFIKRYRELTRT